MEHSPPRSKKSWSIYGRTEITTKYKIEERIGSGAYSDVYKARRLSDNTLVALKEVHDHQSAFREIEALQALKNCPNVVVLNEYFWSEDEDAVLVLEYLRADLCGVIREAKKRGGGIGVGEVKRWMIQVLRGVDACHRNMVVHRDLKTGNLLIGDDGVLKLADFGQARILMEPGFVESEENLQPYEMNPSTSEIVTPPADFVPVLDYFPGGDIYQDQGFMNRDAYYREMSGYKVKSSLEDLDNEIVVQDGDTSCLATGTVSDIGEEAMRSSFSYEAEDEGNRQGSLTSCVGTRWFRAPELLYGSTEYGLEIDLWSMGCIFAELLNLEPLFPGTSDIDQLSRIINVLGNLTEEVWPGCSKLTDYKIISFATVQNPIGLEACLPNCSQEEISIVKKLICYNPASRATAMELLNEEYFSKEPLPVPITELWVPSTNSRQDEDSGGGWYNEDDSDSDAYYKDSPRYYL